ncbi:MAG: hypothetical protein AAE987_05995 [Thermoplasmataceae archaeon]|jgi:hypothetical protein
MGRLISILFIIVIVTGFSLVTSSFHETNSFARDHQSLSDATFTNANVPVGYDLYNYNGSIAVQYGVLIDSSYFHKEYYPSGENLSVFQKNLDFFNSEDCAHFVSEALIHGGLFALSLNPPGDNLTNYLSGFPGSYGIVGVYRLADYLAGYDLPIFPVNSTIEGIIGYQPIPASYYGSPHASVFYVTNNSLLPSYFLWPGDVVMDGGVGNGHAMLYIGNGTVVQTDPAGKWQYTPGADANITFNYLNQYNGKNVSAIYIHIPTFHGKREVRITALSGSSVIPNGSEAGTVKLIGSFPQGVGLGNYSYSWSDNGKVLSGNQTTRITLTSGENKIELEATGSNGTAYANFTLEGGEGFSLFSFPGLLVIVLPVIGIVVAATVLLYRRR